MSTRSVYLLVLVSAFILTATGRAQDANCVHRAVFVSVVDKNGALVEGLAAADFHAEFHGKPVKILSVTPDDRPRRIVILLDASGSMFGANGMKWWLAWASALQMAQSNLPRISLALLVFRQDIVERVDFSLGTSGVAERLKQIGGNSDYAKNLRGQTALFDTILGAIELLGPSGQGDIIYAITDGGDNKSRNSFQKVQRALESADVRLYALILSHLNGRMVETPEEEYGKSNLAQLVDGTGGVELEPVESTPLGVRLDKDERQRIAKMLELYYRQMVHPYRMDIELPQMPDKPSGWRLRLSDARNHDVKGSRVVYPHELTPCALLTHAN